MDSIKIETVIGTLVARAHFDGEEFKGFFIEIIKPDGTPELLDTVEVCNYTDRQPYIMQCLYKPGFDEPFAIETTDLEDLNDDEHE